MGKRVTRTAEHVPAAVIQERMRTEARAWRRRYWHIIWLALTGARQAEEIAREAGVSLATVHRVLARYRVGGVAAIESTCKGGRRHGCLELWEEGTFLAPASYVRADGPACNRRC
jgi:Winged helix-turn helix